MDGRNENELLIGPAALAHLTGPSRGSMTWLSGSTLSVHLSRERIVSVLRKHPDEERANLIAWLHPTEDSYNLEVCEGQVVWVNGVPVTTQLLKHSDIIEFGDTGPMSRFLVYQEDRPVHKLVTDILRDGLGYLKASRQPYVKRLLRAMGHLLRQLARETTTLFRVGVVAAILALTVLIYQQNQLNSLLQQQLDSGSERLDSFASALVRNRNESLTTSDLNVLRQELGYQLSSNAKRLKALEFRTEASGRVIAQSLPAITFLQGSYSYRDRESGRMLRHLVDQSGRMLFTPLGQPHLTIVGDGPVAERQFTGTGFVVGGDGVLITNRHVAMPWESDANGNELIARGLDPTMVKFIVYLPGKALPIDVELLQASEEADLAILRFKEEGVSRVGLKLSENAPSPGDEVIVMGYPTGLRSMLAQSGAEFIAALQQSENTGFWEIATRLAEANQIAPLASRGIIGQVTPAAIVYDAETTLGGSGGPVLDIHGAVVAVNSAILPEYGGSNLGVPVEKIRALLNDAGLK